MKKVLYIFLLIQIGMSSISQSNMNNALPTQSDQLSTLLNHHSQFRSEERVEIFQLEAAKYLSTNIDSAFILYDFMAQFGKSIKDRLLVGQAYASKAQLLEMKGQWDESMIALYQSINYLEDFPKYHALKLGALAGIYNIKNNKDSADYYSEMALNIGLSVPDNNNLSTLYNFRAMALVGLKRYSSAVEHYQKALDHIKDAPSDLNKCVLHRDIASTYALLEDYKNAEFHLNRGLQIAEQNNYVNLKSELLNMLGYRHLKNQEINEAIHSLLAANKIFQEKNNGARLEENHLMLSIAYLSQGDLSSGEFHIKEADKIRIEGQYLKNDIISNLAKAKLAELKNDKQQAERLYKDVVKYTRESDFSNFAHDGIKGLIQLYQKQNRWKEADVLKDSLIAKVERKNITT